MKGRIIIKEEARSWLSVRLGLFDPRRNVKNKKFPYTVVVYCQCLHYLGSDVCSVPVTAVYAVLVSEVAEMSVFLVPELPRPVPRAENCQGAQQYRLTYEKVKSVWCWERRQFWLLTVVSVGTVSQLEGG